MDTGQIQKIEKKEKELTVGILNSIALYIYHAYPNGFGGRDAVDVYNEWAECGVKFNDPVNVSAALSHVNQLMKVDRIDLERALEYDGLGLKLEEL